MFHPVKALFEILCFAGAKSDLGSVAAARGFLLDDDLVGFSENLASNVDHGGPFHVVEWADDPVIDVGQHRSGLVRNIGRCNGRSVLEAHSKMAFDSPC